MANFWTRAGAIVGEVGEGAFAAGPIGYVTETAATPAVGSITLTEFAQYRVFEGAAGSAQVTLSGSHTGPTDTIEYRIETIAGVPVTSWATLQASVAEGAFSGNVTVPRGGWYYAHVRKAAATSTEAIHTQRWGVGVILGGFGQSQMQGFLNSAYGASTDRAVIHDGTNWLVMPTTGAGQNKFAEHVSAAMDCPVAVIATGIGGTPISYWWSGAKTSGYNAWEANLTAAGGKMSAFLYWQGEGDYNISRPKAAYQSDLNALFAQLHTDYGAGLPIIVAALGRYVGSSPAPEHDIWEGIRDAHMEAMTSAASHRGFHTYDLPLSDNVHVNDTGQLSAGLRAGQCLLHAYGVSSYSRGPSVAYALRYAPTIIDVGVTHDASTDFTPTTGVTGFTVLDGGTPVTISSAARQSANVIRLTLASTPTGTVTVRYAYGCAPVVTGVVKGNAALSLPLQPTLGDVTALGRKVLLNCIQRVGGAAAASITGLRWAFFDQSAPNALTAPVVTGTGESTDASGVLEIDVIGTSLNVGDTGYLVTDTAAGVGFAGPVVVSG